MPTPRIIGLTSAATGSLLLLFLQRIEPVGWLCQRCARDAGFSSRYPPSPDVYCAGCDTCLTPAERIAACLAAVVSVQQGECAHEETVDVEGAASLLKTTVRGIYSLRDRGNLPPKIGTGRRLLWRRADLLEWAARVPEPGKKAGR